MKRIRTIPVYLDNHATTPVDPRVVDFMVPFLKEHYGNAASRQHAFGWKAEAAVEHARVSIGLLINADAEELVFTSGATESINLALKGVAEGYSSKGNHIITVATEHRATLDACRRLEQYGLRATLLHVDSAGMIDLDELRRAINEKTILISVMAANNEIGTIAPIAEIGKICKETGILFHTDATQAVGKILIDVKRMNIDLMSFSAHKMYGPKGIGALYIRHEVPHLKVVAQMDGGGHERGYRSGTLNVPGIAGFGEAARTAISEMQLEAVRVKSLRDHLTAGLTGRLKDIWINGHATQRLWNNANIGFVGVSADALMMKMKDIAVSSGSACSSASPEPSHVLTATGLNRQSIQSCIRFGLGRFTTKDEIEYTIERVVEAVTELRSSNQQSTKHQIETSPKSHAHETT